MVHAFEFHFHPVGSGERSGECITARIAVDGIQNIYVIDGGTQETGAHVSRFIRTYYGSDKIDHLILTHPDDDHASELKEMLSHCVVGNLWAILPWEHSHFVSHLFYWRKSQQDLKIDIVERHPRLAEIVSLANQQGTRILQPLQGCNIGPFHVVSPHLSFYCDLLPFMSKTPPALPGITTPANFQDTPSNTTTSADAINVQEDWQTETLTESGNTSAANESSVVLYGNIANHRILLTGDAGMAALLHSIVYCSTAQAWGLDLPMQQFNLMSIPHHGSRNNITPYILNQLIGPPVPQGVSRHLHAYASASIADPIHPRRVVTNAFVRRGAVVATTRGTTLRYRHDPYSVFAPLWPVAPDDFGPIRQIPFSKFVEGNT